ncbi:MAG TPA: nucleotidyltransferase family protein [Tepidisphaeraceae bacterium]
MVRAVEKVKQRLLRAASALRQAGIPYAVAGGNAVALWVSRVDEAAVRNTQDVDILLRRSDLEAARRALESAGFVYRHDGGMDVFLDGPQAKPRDAVHIIFANERVRPVEMMSNPDVVESEDAPQFRVLALEALVQIKLTAFRDKDRTHLRDLIEVGLIDRTWPGRFLPELGARLQSLLDTPGG